jgi:hypothetical protein
MRFRASRPQKEKQSPELSSGALWLAGKAFTRMGMFGPIGAWMGRRCSTRREGPIAGWSHRQLFCGSGRGGGERASSDRHKKRLVARGERGGREGAGGHGRTGLSREYAENGKGGGIHGD